MMGILRVLAESGQGALGMNDVGKQGRAKVQWEVVNLFGKRLFDKFHQPVDHVEFQKHRDYGLLDWAFLE